jgi:type IV secretion system protein VirB11
MKHDNRLLANLEHNLGPVVMSALQDPDVVEIMLNPDGKLWIEKLGQEMRLASTIEPSQGRLIISLIASGLETVVTAENPIVEGELPLDGSRFEGLLPPVVSGPSFTIRKKASKVFTLENYIEAGILSPDQASSIRQAIQNRLNILVVGGTGSGKTTLVNACIHALAELCPNDRLLVLEDTMEIQSESPNTVFFHTSDHVDMRRLVKVTMRYRPTRIIVGEVRDGAALDLLKAWNTGHPGGIATVHANSAAEGLDRLEELIAEATPAPKQKLIGKSVGLVIFIERTPGSRRITEILKVTGYDAGIHQYHTEVVCHV